MKILVTEAAQQQLKNAITEADYIRLGVLPGGCSGFKYNFVITGDTASDDEIVEVNGVKFAVDPFSAQYIDGIEVDFINTFQESGFKFNNPNSAGGCGCGTSFSV